MVSGCEAPKVSFVHQKPAGKARRTPSIVPGKKIHKGQVRHAVKPQVMVLSSSPSIDYYQPRIEGLRFKVPSVALQATRDTLDQLSMAVLVAGKSCIPHKRQSMRQVFSPQSPVRGVIIGKYIAHTIGHLSDPIVKQTILSKPVPCCQVHEPVHINGRVLASSE
jgi:hypothetical protein